jgi:RNA polymerase sigma factor (sigma-70 family)
LRSEVARQLEKQDKPPRETDLAAFADREKLLKYAQTARLAPQELEVFRLYIEHPTLKYREIADQLGISTNQVGVIKHRIKNKLAASL